MSRYPHSNIRFLPRLAWLRAALVAVTAVAAVAATLVVTQSRGDSEAVSSEWTAVADTYVIEEYPRSTSGDRDKLVSAQWPEWHTKSYVRFDVDQLRTDLSIASVTVAFTVQDAAGGPTGMDLRTVPSNSWSESDTDHSNRPGSGDVVATADDTAGDVVRFDVTDHVREAGTYSFSLVNRSETSGLVAYSRESGSYGPRLIVEYGAAPTPTGTASPTPTESASPTSPPPSESPSASPTPTDSPSPTGSPAPADMLCGAAFKPESDGESYQEALAREDRMLGGLDIARVYYTGAPKQWPGRLDTDGRPMIVSFKMNPRDVLNGEYDDHMRRWFAEAPTGQDTYWVYYHEPEDNIERGQFSASDYRAAWQHLNRLADQADNSRLIATLVLMGFSTEESSKRDWRSYYPGTDVVEVLAWDIYNYTNEGDGGYRDPASLFDSAVEASRSVGLPFAVAETGSAIARGDDGSGRADWVRSTLRYLADNDAVFVSYFDMYIEAGHGPQHYELRDSASQSAYREVCD